MELWVGDMDGKHVEIDGKDCLKGKKPPSHPACVGQRSEPEPRARGLRGEMQRAGRSAETPCQTPASRSHLHHRRHGRPPRGRLPRPGRRGRLHLRCSKPTKQRPTRKSRPVRSSATSRRRTTLKATGRQAAKVSTTREQNRGRYEQREVVVMRGLSWWPKSWKIGRALDQSAQEQPGQRLHPQKRKRCSLDPAFRTEVTRHIFHVLVSKPCWDSRIDKVQVDNRKAYELWCLVTSQHMTFKKGFSIIEALLVLCISLILCLVIIPVLLLRLGFLQHEEHAFRSPETLSEIKEPATVTPSIDLPKPVAPILPASNFEASGRADSGERVGPSKPLPLSPLPEVPSSKP